MFLYFYYYPYWLQNSLYLFVYFFGKNGELTIATSKERMTTNIISMGATSMKSLYASKINSWLCGKEKFFMLQSIGIIVVKSSETRSVYNCRYSSG